MVEPRAPRRSYSYRTAALDYSVSVAQLRRDVDAGRIRTRRVGPSMVRLHPDDLEALYGFTDAQPARTSPRAREWARREAARIMGG